MRYWNTGDTPTNSNLSSLENLAHPWAGIDAERLLDVIRGVIRIEKMLPTATLTPMLDEPSSGSNSRR